MTPDGYKRYIFQGSAVGVSLRFKELQDTFFEGSAALPPTGGNVNSFSGPRRAEWAGHGLLLSYDQAMARVRGDFREGDSGPVQIVAESTVSGLNILDRVTIEYLGNHLVYEHNGSNARLSLASPLQFVNLLIDKRPLVVEVEPDLEQVLNGSSDRPEPALPVVRELRFPQGTPDAVKELNGNKLIIDNFGALYFGELVRLCHGHRGLTLLRCELNCSVGSVSLASSNPGPGEQT